jgi:hypothetical protein
MASKNKTTNPTRTQDTISQHELTLLAIAQNELAAWTATCERLHASVAQRRRGGVTVEPGRFFLNGTSVGMRA